MILLFLQVAFAADDQAAPPESRVVVQPEEASAKGLTFFGTFQARGSASNLASTNPFLDGQVVGDIGGSNGIVVDPESTSAYVEQRANGFFTYKPPMLDGKAGLTAAFEIDFAYGDRSYGTGGNTGGGFGGDQVNLQTRRLHADFWRRGKHDVHAIVGLQFVGDSVTDPTASTPDDLLRSGARLMFFGSEAAGVSVYGRLHDAGGDALRWRLGSYTLVEQGLSSPDDAWLNMADIELDPAYGVRVGLHAWYLQDRTEGTGGALGIGPTSALWEMQGGTKYDLFEGYAPPEDAAIFADLGWIGLDAAYNPGLTLDAFGVSGAAFVNVGRMYAPIVHDDTVQGALFDVEARYRWTQGKGSVARAEVLVTTGDSASSDTYSGVVTGNAYGVAGAFHATHGTVLLFPDPRAINRLTPVLTDVSGRGQGVQALTASFGYDVVPDRFNLTLGGGSAMNAAGASWGTEINARASYQPLPLLDLAVYGAYLAPGAASGLTESPWAAFAAIDWLVL